MHFSKHWTEYQNFLSIKRLKNAKIILHERDTLHRTKVTNKTDCCAVLDDLAAVLRFRHFVWDLGRS